MGIQYKRVLLKLSGEALQGGGQQSIDSAILSQYADEIKRVVEKGVQVGIVIGGGNIFRGLGGTQRGFDRVKGDQMGMLATVINSIAIQSALEGVDVKAKVLTSIRMEPFGEYYSSAKAVEYMNDGYVVIVAGGTGNPFFTTDTASALRGVELGVEALLKGTNVDGVYTADPKKDPKATRFDRISFDEVYERNLRVMDLTAFTLCKENSLPIVVFDMNENGTFERLVMGENVGTLVS